MKGAKRLAVLAMFTAIALTIFVAEAQIPPIVPIPGVKLGLANIVTLIAMALLGRRQAGRSCSCVSCSAACLPAACRRCSSALRAACLPILSCA
ncbi:MAG: Gx transporter family protein [Oscillospiraceae bacterium]